ncbi:MAG: lipopolysaccharide assembly protein LapA domain-containing protein, partial [Microthrixaceae bacterium]
CENLTSSEAVHYLVPTGSRRWMMSEQSEAQESGGGLNFRLVLGGLAAVALALFVFQNTQKVEVNFLWVDGSLSLFLLLLITVALTLILVGMATWVLRRRD